MQNRAVISGILSIVSGSLGFLGFLVIILAVLFFSFFPADLAGGSDLEQSMITVMVIVYAISGLITLALSILAIVGGVYSLKKKNWTLSLTGAIAGLLVFFPTGIPAVIFISMGKQEFNQTSTGQPSLS